VSMRRRYKAIPLVLSVKRSYAGLGLFAGENIPKNACVIEYVGKVLAKGEEYTSRSRYLFEINSRKTIDGAMRSNTARYINHSCKPNCEPEIYKSRVFIFSKRTIKKGEELCYDYGIEYAKEYFSETGCRCGNCPSKK